MLKTILSIAGRPGLYRLVSQGKNMLIVESLSTGKRTPAYAHDKIISLGDIAIYTVEEDKPLSQVFEAVKEKAAGQPVNVKDLGGDDKVRAYFAEILPDFDQERVYTADIKKLLNWYNQLLAAGITEFVDQTTSEETKVEDATEA